MQVDYNSFISHHIHFSFQLLISSTLLRNKQVEKFGFVKYCDSDGFSTRMQFWTLFRVWSNYRKEGYSLPNKGMANERVIWLICRRIYDIMLGSGKRNTFRYVHREQKYDASTANYRSMCRKRKEAREDVTRKK